MFVSPLNSHVEILTQEGLQGGAQVRRVGPFAGISAHVQEAPVESLVSSPNVRIQGEGIGYEPGRGSLQQSLAVLVP